MSNDKILIDYLNWLRTKRQSQVSFVSNTFVNTLVSNMKGQIFQKLRNAIDKESFGEFALMLDSTVDRTNKSQLSIVLRHVDRSLGIHSTTISMQPMASSSGKDYSSITEKIISSIGLKMKNCISLCTDGASAMKNVLASEIAKNAPELFYCWCISHRLHLSINNPLTSNPLLKDLWNKLNWIARHYNRYHHAAVIWREILVRMSDKYKNINRALVPIAIGETRWSSKLRCLDHYYGKISHFCGTIYFLSHFLSYLQKSKNKKGNQKPIAETIETILYLCNPTNILKSFIIRRILQDLNIDILVSQGSDINIMQVPTIIKYATNKIDALLDLNGDALKQLLQEGSEFIVECRDFLKLITQEKLLSAEEKLDVGLMSIAELSKENYPEIESFIRDILKEIQSAFNERFVSRATNDNLDQFFSEIEFIQPKNLLHFRVGDEQLPPLPELMTMVKVPPGEHASFRKGLEKFVVDLQSFYAIHKDEDLIDEKNDFDIGTRLIQRFFSNEINRNNHDLVNKMYVKIYLHVVSQAACERNFSALKRIKSSLRSQFNDENLESNMLIYLNRNFIDVMTMIPQLVGKTASKSKQLANKLATGKLRNI